MVRSPFSHIFILIAFLANIFGLLPTAQSQVFKLPAPGVMVHLSPEFNPSVLKGIKIHTEDPFLFDFILDKGDSRSSNESAKLIKYFLAGLTIPEKDLWVNLSPYEKNRIIPNSFGLTEMGRDLLAEDYMLKQITASLIYPEDEIGKRFWKKVYAQAQAKYGTTNIPVNTFNKVWIVPEKAVVFENAKEGTAYVVESKLRVMLEQDFLSLNKHMQTSDVNALGSQVVREIVIPELTREVNENKNFAPLRQVYNSLILATWYKKKIKDSILAQVYADKNKIKGVEYNKSIINNGGQPGDMASAVSPSRLPNDAGLNVKASQGNPINDVEQIYQRYLQAFKKGVYNYIKEDVDPMTQVTTPRKYFSGGIAWNATNLDPVTSIVHNVPDLAMLGVGNYERIETRLGIANAVLIKGVAPSVKPVDQAMFTESTEESPRLSVKRIIDAFSKIYDKNDKFKDILRVLKERSSSVEDFSISLKLLQEGLGSSFDEHMNWRIFYMNFTAWAARVASKNFTELDKIESLNKLSLSQGSQSSYKPQKVLLIHPKHEDIGLIYEWEQNAGIDEVVFMREWLDAVKGKKNILAVVSSDIHGKRHLEGWVAYEVYPLYGLYISYIETAPWHRKRINGRGWKGVGSLLIAKVIDQSLRLGYKGRVFSLGSAFEEIALSQRLGAQRDPGIKSDKYTIPPFNYFSSSVGQDVIKAQNNMNGDLSVEDQSMISDQQGTGSKNKIKFWHEPKSSEEELAFAFWASAHLGELPKAFNWGKVIANKDSIDLFWQDLPGVWLKADYQRAVELLRQAGLVENKSLDQWRFKTDGFVDNETIIKQKIQEARQKILAYEKERFSRAVSDKVIEEMSNKRQGRMVSRDFWTNEDNAREAVWLALDQIPGFETARRSGNIKLMVELYRVHVMSYKVTNTKRYRNGQSGYFEEVGGLTGLMGRPRSFLDKTDSPGSLLRFALPGLIDEDAKDTLRPWEVENDIWDDQRLVKKAIIQALDKISRFEQARKTGDIKMMAKLYRQDVLNKETRKQEDRQLEYFKKVGGLGGLVSQTKTFLGKMGSPSVLLRFALPGLIDEDAEGAIRPWEVENAWDERLAKKAIIQALDQVPGFETARKVLDIKGMAQLYRKYVMTYKAQDRVKHSDGQLGYFYEKFNLNGLMSIPRPFLERSGSPASVLKFAVPGLIDADAKGALRPWEVEYVWDNEQLAKKAILEALDRIEGFELARKAGDVKTMAELYRQNVVAKYPRQRNFFEAAGLYGLMKQDRPFLDSKNSAAALLRFALPELAKQDLAMNTVDNDQIVFNDFNGKQRITDAEANLAAYDPIASPLTVKYGDKDIAPVDSHLQKVFPKYLIYKNRINKLLNELIDNATFRSTQKLGKTSVATVTSSRYRSPSGDEILKIVIDQPYLDEEDWSILYKTLSNHEQGLNAPENMTGLYKNMNGAFTSFTSLAKTFSIPARLEYERNPNGKGGMQTRLFVKFASVPERSGDMAMNVHESNTGGIDLTPANMNLQTKNAGQAIKFHLDAAQLARLQNAPGFVPVIINIQALPAGQAGISDLRKFLGLPDNQPLNQAAASF